MIHKNAYAGIIAIVLIVAIVYASSGSQVSDASANSQLYGDKVVGLNLQGSQYEAWHDQASADGRLSRYEIEQLLSLMQADQRYETEAQALNQLLSSANLVGAASENDEDSEESKVTIRDLMDNIEVEDGTAWYTTDGSIDVGAWSNGKDTIGVSVRIKF